MPFGAIGARFGAPPGGLGFGLPFFFPPFAPFAPFLAGVLVKKPLCSSRWQREPSKTRPAHAYSPIPQLSRTGGAIVQMDGWKEGRTK